MAQQAQAQQQMNGSTNTVFNTQIRLDLSYVFTKPGMLKLAVVILNLLGFICVISSPFRGNGRGVYFNLVAHMGLWFSGVMLVLYLYHVIERYHNVPWLKVEMITCALLMFLYLIAATIAVAFGAAAYSAAGFFGYLAMVLYGVDAFLKVQSLRAGELAQGHRVHSKQTVVIPPAMP